MRAGVSPSDRDQSGDLAWMAALDAGYDTLMSGVTLDRFSAQASRRSTWRPPRRCPEWRMSSSPAAWR